MSAFARYRLYLQLVLSVFIALAPWQRKLARDLRIVVALVGTLVAGAPFTDVIML